ncbi:MAG: hypothetical protein ABSF64_18290 [Bryobacteraceae bacterium]|jgi:hypothetical protein
MIERVSMVTGSRSRTMKRMKLMPIAPPVCASCGWMRGVSIVSITPILRVLCACAKSAAVKLPGCLSQRSILGGFSA